MVQPAVGDKELAADLLMTEKAIAERYHWAALEAMHPQVRQSMLQIHDEIHDLARRVFDYMYRKGWYQPRAADDHTIGWFQNAIRTLQQDVGTAMHNLPAPGQAPWGYAPGPVPAWAPEPGREPAFPAPGR